MPRCSKCGKTVSGKKWLRHKLKRCPNRGGYLCADCGRRPVRKQGHLCGMCRARSIKRAEKNMQKMKDGKPE